MLPRMPAEAEGVEGGGVEVVVAAAGVAAGVAAEGPEVEEGSGVADSLNLKPHFAEEKNCEASMALYGTANTRVATGNAETEVKVNCRGLKGCANPHSTALNLRYLELEGQACLNQIKKKSCLVLFKSPLFSVLEEVSNILHCSPPQGSSKLYSL